jgi:hypothetical protein
VGGPPPVLVLEVELVVLPSEVEVNDEVVEELDELVVLGEPATPPAAPGRGLGAPSQLRAKINSAAKERCPGVGRALKARTPSRRRTRRP